jgi:PAT family beta-lactamase induction signal transducer AmpG
VAYIAYTTHPLYTATQFALFTSLAAVPRTFANAATGYLVEDLGWRNFFLFCFVAAIPGMLLLMKVAPWSIDGSQQLGLLKPASCDH